MGAIVAFPGEILRQTGEWAKGTTDLQHYGWKVCDGASLVISEYPEFFAVLGYRYGAGDDQMFKLPDFRGQFLRAVDPEGKNDPEYKDRTVAAGASSDDHGAGSTQDCALQDHEHSLTQTESALPGGVEDAYENYQPTGNADTGYVDTDQDTQKEKTVQVSQYETRPTNIAVYWLIKCLPDANRWGEFTMRWESIIKATLGAIVAHALVATGAFIGSVCCGSHHVVVHAQVPAPAPAAPA